MLTEGALVSHLGERWYVQSRDVDMKTVTMVNVKGTKVILEEETIKAILFHPIILCRSLLIWEL